MHKKKDQEKPRTQLIRQRIKCVRTMENRGKHRRLCRANKRKGTGSPKLEKMPQEKSGASPVCTERGDVLQQGLATAEIFTRIRIKAFSHKVHGKLLAFSRCTFDSFVCVNVILITGVLGFRPNSMLSYWTRVGTVHRVQWRR